jgi:hypothetical protein
VGLAEIGKRRGEGKRNGYSLYQTNQLKEFLSIGMIPDLVQLHYNLLDKKFEDYFKQLKAFRCVIYLISVFLHFFSRISRL